MGATNGIVDVNSSSLTCAGTFTHPAGFLEGNPSPAPAPSCGATATTHNPTHSRPFPASPAPPTALPPVGGGSSATFHDGQSLGPIFYMGAWYNVYTSGTAMFTAADVGRTITGTGIPASTTIVAVQDPYVGLSNPDASGPSGLTFTIVGREGAFPP